MVVDIIMKARDLLGRSVSLNTSRLRARPLKKMTERELLNLESAIGSRLFGEVPKGHRREFFCVDKKTWMWYEQWLDAKGKSHEMTTRYEVHEQGILKVQDGPRYTYISGQELENLTLAVQTYYEQVARGVYGTTPRQSVGH